MNVVFPGLLNRKSKQLPRVGSGIERPPSPTVAQKLQLHKGIIERDSAVSGYTNPEGYLADQGQAL